MSTTVKAMKDTIQMAIVAGCMAFNLATAQAYFGRKWGKCPPVRVYKVEAEVKAEFPHYTYAEVEAEVNTRLRVSSRTDASLSTSTVKDCDGFRFGLVNSSTPDFYRGYELDKGLSAEQDDIIAQAYILWHDRKEKYLAGEADHPYSTIAAVCIAVQNYRLDEKRAKRASSQQSWTIDRWCPKLQRHLSDKEIRQKVCTEVQQEQPELSGDKLRWAVDKRLRRVRSYHVIRMPKRGSERSYIGRQVLATLADIDDQKSSGQRSSVQTLDILKNILKGYTIQEITRGQVIAKYHNGRKLVVKKVNIGPRVDKKTVRRRLRKIADDVQMIINELLFTGAKNGRGGGGVPLNILDRRSPDPVISVDKFALGRQSTNKFLNGQVYKLVQRKDWWTPDQIDSGITPIDLSPARRTVQVNSGGIIVWYPTQDHLDNDTPVPVYTATPDWEYIPVKNENGLTSREYITELLFKGEYLARMVDEPMQGLPERSYTIDHRVSKCESKVKLYICGNTVYVWTE